MKAENNKYILTVEQEESPESPRDWDNLGIMICWHRKYSLGDEHTYKDTDEMYGELYRQFIGEEPEQFDHETDEDFGKRITEEVNNHIIILPLMLYDHSGISMSTSRGYPFNDQWDAGQVGWIYAQKGDDEEKTEKILVSEVDTYDKYLRGDILCFRLDKKMYCPTCKHTFLEQVDSCCGFYGLEDIADYLPDDAKHLLDKLRE
jgi:hypothetical protein